MTEAKHNQDAPAGHELPTVPAAAVRTVPPPRQGLYDPANEKDACGVGFVVDIKGRRSHRILEQAITVLKNLDHRGACGCEVNTGDGAGVLLQMPHKFLARVCADLQIELPRLAQKAHISLRRVEPLDDSLESVFGYLVES